jgi:hypothetical protein
MEPNGSKKTWKLPEPIGSLVLRRSGGAILALRSGFFAFDFSTGEAKRICESQPGELRPRLNDGKADRQGRFVAGSMDFEECAPVGKLFRADPDLSIHTTRRGNHLLQRAVLEPRRMHPLLRRHGSPRDLRVRLRSDDRESAFAAPVCELRNAARLS